MIKFNKYNFSLESFFEIRTIYEDEFDIDLIIPFGRRTVNIYFENMPNYLEGRFQILKVENMIIRLAKSNENNLSTIHFLRDIDLKSSFLNFVFNYENRKIEIDCKENNIDIYFK